MARYIDADKLIEEIDKAQEELKTDNDALWGIRKKTYNLLCRLRRMIDNIPTADVVEVVRCKDCTHYIEMKGFDYSGRKARSCIWHSALRRENDYCSDGIRKGGAE